MTDRQITHAPGCWGWGPRHYECAVGQIECDEALLRQALEAMEVYAEYDPKGWGVADNAIAALRERLFDDAQERPAWQYTLRHMGGLKPYLTQRQYEAQSPAIQKWYEPVSRQQSGECICIKCGLRQDGPREEPTF